MSDHVSHSPPDEYAFDQAQPVPTILDEDPRESACPGQADGKTGKGTQPGEDLDSVRKFYVLISYDKGKAQNVVEEELNGGNEDEAEHEGGYEGLEGAEEEEAGGAVFG
mmetsp:Transcript_15581/g.32782  ORF Transcript_15581/g.32782 Transcript_15581/m.32782 type:complete len:109 (-) Transcript_15581:702-1028(-)